MRTTGVRGGLAPMARRITQIWTPDKDSKNVPWISETFKPIELNRYSDIVVLYMTLSFNVVGSFGMVNNGGFHYISLYQVFF